VKGELVRPIGGTGDLFGERVLVVAPHYDDEVLGCGGVVAQRAAAGAEVSILFLSDGSGGVEQVTDPAAYAARRRAEAREATARLGASIDECLELPDGQLERHVATIADALEKALARHRPDLVLAPGPCEVSTDHRAAFLALHRVLSRVRDEDPLDAVTRALTVAFYEINHPQHPSLLVDVAEVMTRVESAMAAYDSQEERHPYWQAALGLRRYRTLSLPPGVTAVEAYRVLEARDFRHVGAQGMIREFGGLDHLVAVDDGPLVSVIVRTKDRPLLLAEALHSVAASSYRRLECVVVNDGGAAPREPLLDASWLPVRVVNLAQNVGRAEAANAGIAAAQGAFVAFLDDDDLVEPEHYAILVDLARGSGSPVVYSDAAVGVYEAAAGGWQRVERRLPYSRDFDPDRLLVDNYIPLHTLLIDRQVAVAAGPLDRQFTFFEDWDFLVRLAAQTPFQHLRQVTCEYRQFRGGGHHVLGERPRERADFVSMKAKVLAKHAARLTAERWARIIDGLRAEAVSERDAAQREAAERHRRHGELVGLREDVRRLEGEQRALGERHESEASALRDALEARDGELRRLYEESAALRGVVDDQTAHLGRVYAEITRLNATIDAMQATRAWRVHRFLQRDSAKTRGA
jgi:LmbE family N-acetylglucosaminyl deacetylase